MNRSAGSAPLNVRQRRYRLDLATRAGPSSAPTEGSLMIDQANVPTPPPPAPVVSTPADGVPRTLQGRIGVIELMLTVLAFSAPLTVVAAFAVFVLTYNRSAPIAFAIAIGLLLLFAVGYTTMTRY